MTFFRVAVLTPGFPFSAIERFGCKGIILLGTEMTETEFSPFASLQIPVVVLDTYFCEFFCGDSHEIPFSVLMMLPSADRGRVLLFIECIDSE